ncbi:unnamed protein product [Discula destructiva]
MATTTETGPSVDTYKLELRSAHGPVYRDVLKTAPRDCDPSEVPVIDLSPLYGDLDARKALAATIRDAAENTGFFYIKNHGIPRAAIDAAHAQAKAFFAQPEDRKREAATAKSAFFNGWTAVHGSFISPTESRDYREGFMWSYDPRYDPEPKAGVPADVAPSLKGEDFVWEATDHLPGFKTDVLAYWRECLTLARRLIRVFALALSLPEAYFDGIVTFPGADGVFNYYPAASEAGGEDAPIDVGLGAHTDLQSFTLLWQDAVGGLQVLTHEGQWVKVPPVQDSFVVNIGDFMSRLSNDRFKSTVHRVFNRAPVDRYSMPFFFGFNFNEKCSVLPSCTSETNPAKYEPITCGEWCELRFAQGSRKTTGTT